MKKRRTLLACLLAVLMLLPLGVPFAVPEVKAAADVWDGTWDGSGFSGNHITSAKGFAQFINNAGTGTSYSGQTVYLDVDIDLNNIDFGNISGGKNVYYSRDNYFQGTFDGQGHTIYNFQMHNSDHRIGVFRAAKNATFKNVNFENAFIDDNDNGNKKNGFAVVVGYGDGNLTFENIHLKNGTVYGYNYVGGLVGEYGADNMLRITNCTNNLTIHADNNYAGGLVGYSKGSVVANDCSNTGEIYAGYKDAAGIAGWIEDDESSFVNCSNYAKVSTDACAGGIVGYFGSKSQDKKMTLTNCYNEGQIESRGNGYVAGGIAGKIDTDAEHSFEKNVNRGAVSAKEDAGGIVGSNIGKGIWRNNKNYGNVGCDNDNAGGILGEVEDDQNKFYNCYNTGSVQGKNSVGGILGYGQDAAHEFYDCGNSGSVTSTSDCAGGIYGYGNSSEPTIEQCWNIGTIKAYNDAGGILGRTYHHSYIRRCFNAGAIDTYNHNGNGAHGGIAGQTSDLSGSSNDNPNMTDCFNWGPVSGGRDDGGLIGKIKDGRTPYYITNSYNAGSVTGTLPYAIIAYGGNVGNNVYYDNNVVMGTAQGTGKSEAELETFDFTLSGNYCKNTWGVSIGGRTYKFPILNWYRNMFSFESKFVDSATGTNETILRNYGESFTVPNPTCSGYSAGQWLSGNTHRLVRDATVTAGNTYLMNTNYDKNAGPADTDTVVQNSAELTEIRSTRTYGLIWKEGAAANMYATSWANEENNTDSRYRAGIDYTIYNLTTGHDVVYTDGSASDYTSGNSQYFKSYQRNGTGAATATLEVDRSKMDDIKDTGIYIDYYPFIYTGPGGVRWGVEIFDPNNADSKGVLNNDHWQADVTGASGKSYHFEQRFNDVNGNDHRCAETSSDFTQEPGGTAATERRYGSYKWYFKGDAPDAGDSVTLRITAICAARYNSGNLQILSEWTDLTIIGTCSHANGHLHATAANAATCTESGNSAYWYCDVCHKYFSDSAATHEIAENSWILPATDHAWGQPTYVWAGDNASVTATRVCANDPANHVETETVLTDYSVIDDAQCGVAGSGKYTSRAFSNPAFTVQTKTVEIPALEHDWNAPTYVWSDDNLTVTATRTCNKGNHPETETVQTDYTVVTPAKCGVAGLGRYTTRAFANGAFAQQTKDVEIPALTHNWNAPTYEWAADGTSCTATRVCGHDASHVETETVETTSNITLQPTCTAKGKTTYTAVFENPAFGTQTETLEDIPATGHNYNEPAATDWTWTKTGDTYTVTVTVTCVKGDDTQTLTASVGDPAIINPTHTQDGSKTFTAVATIGDQEFTATKTDEIKAEGHSFTVLQSDGTHHWYKCTGCNEIRDKEAHYGGEATCTALAVCDVCGTPYGEMLDHSFNVLQHDETDHWYKCENCSATTAKIAHTGGEATCVAKAECEVCHEAYGEVNADNHKNTRETEAVTANCVTEGFTAGVYCDDCHKYVSGHESQGYDTTETGHVYGGWASNGNGTHSKVCSRCAEGTKNHTVTENCSGGEATCTALAVCDVCHEAYGKMLDHQWEWNADKAPTCSSTGLKHEECAVCHQKQNENTVIPTLEHAWNGGAYVVQPTCTEGGSMVYTCTRCGEKKYETVDALGHEIVDDYAVEPTCTERGITAGTHCARCGRVLTPQIVVSELGHDYGEWGNRVEPTCTDAGHEERTCARCGYVDVREIPANGHQWGAWSVTTPAKCTEKGIETAECTVCHVTKTRDVPATGHKWISGEGTTATCTEAGTAVWVCANGCGETKTENVAALGHDWSAWEVVTPATAMANGIERRTCARCGETAEREIAYGKNKDRNIQFVAAPGVAITVHAGPSDVVIRDQSSKAIPWYAYEDLRFEVTKTSSWSAEGYTVLVNRQVLAPDADGGYTIPGGKDYAIVSVELILNDTPATPGGSGSSGSGVCKLCGQNHGSSFWGRIVAFFHAIIYFFKHLFGG